MSHLPVINISALLSNVSSASDQQKTANLIGDACRTHGFFYIEGHGVSETLQQELEAVSKVFFALPETEKMHIAMNKGGKAWRGYFPVEGELTGGKPDLKEGLYFGQEFGDDDPRVVAGWPLHGRNLFPHQPGNMAAVVQDYMQALEQTAQAVLRGLAVSLELPANYFYQQYTAQPLALFRIFHYPPQKQIASRQWGVGEHTDYGLLTLLKQDLIGGLQVKWGDVWIDAPPLPDTFVCNIGDMLDRMTGGHYRSTPHRVLNTSGQDRYSYPFFFDPAFDAPVQPIAGMETPDDVSNARWDNENLHHFDGTYGEYLLRKIGRVFPDLQKDVL